AEIASVADRTTVLRAGRVVESVEMASADIRGLVRSMVGRDIVSLDRTVAATLGVATADAPASVAPPAAAAPAPGAGRRRREAALVVDGVSYRDAAGGPRPDARPPLPQPRGDAAGA